MIFNPWELAKYIKALYNEQLVQKEFLKNIVNNQSLIFKKLKRMSETFDQFVTDINATYDQLQKSSNEIIAKLADLEAAIQTQNNIPDNVAEAFAKLKTAVQANDDIVPDAVVTPPATTGADGSAAPAGPAADGTDAKISG